MKAGIALLAMMAIAGCATPPSAPSTAPARPIGAIGGPVSGYLTGDLAEGHAVRLRRVAGATGLATNEVGAYMNRQEQALRTAVGDSGVRVIRQGDELLLTIPSGINFAYKSAQIDPAFRPTLDRVAAALAEFDRTWVDVYGHTDAIGSEGYNRGLASERAAAVAELLRGRGVAGARIGIRSFGFSQPIATNETEEGRAANRRVEIRIVPIPASELR